MAERRSRRRPVKVRVPVAMPDGSAPERWLSNIRVSSFTVMILALLVLGVVVLAPSLKLLIQQRSQIAALEKSVAAQKHHVSSLESQVARWNDPAYIEAQARNRLLFVLPGEYSYLVIPEAGVDVGTTTAPISKHIQTTKIDWVQALTSSILRAGLSTQTKSQLQSPSIPVPTSTGAPTKSPRQHRVSRPPFEPPSALDVATVSAQLGRPARDVIGISARCVCGAPTVVSTAPRLQDGTPFPTLYYLSHPAATAAVSTLEANGVMAELAALLEGDIAAEYRAAHESYLADRDGIEFVPELDGVSAGGMPTRVKCLHALVAHSLAAGAGVNPIGDLALVRSTWSPLVCECADYGLGEAGLDSAGLDNAGPGGAGLDDAGIDSIRLAAP